MSQPWKKRKEKTSSFSPSVTIYWVSAPGIWVSKTHKSWQKKYDACNVTRWFLGTPPIIAPALEDHFRLSLRWVQRWQAPNGSNKHIGEELPWWSRICLATQRMWVPSLVREVGSHTLWSDSACVPQLESQLSLGATIRESVLCNQGSRESN